MIATATAPGSDQHEHAGGVRAALRLDVGIERDRHHERDEREDDDQRPVRARPFRRHAVARQIAGHEVEQPGERRRAGEPQHRDRADVVHGAERGAEVLVREVGERASRRRTARHAAPSPGISTVVTTLLTISSTLMISAAREAASSCCGYARVGRSSVSSGSPLTSGITATPVSNPDRPSASFGNTSSAAPIISIGLPCCASNAVASPCSSSGWAQISPQPDHDHHRVQHEVDGDDDRPPGRSLR